MAIEKRVKILTEAEAFEFFNPPIFTNNDQRFFFALNDKELECSLKIRNRRMRCMFTLLLGYFKAKPMVLSPNYHLIKQI